MIYIVVDVTYDYYRFQDNVFASTSYKECCEWIVKEVKKNKDSHKGGYKNIDYDKDSEKMYNLDNKECSHFWIQKM